MEKTKSPTATVPSKKSMTTMMTPTTITTATSTMLSNLSNSSHHHSPRQQQSRRTVSNAMSAKHPTTTTTNNNNHHNANKRCRRSALLGFIVACLILAMTVSMVLTWSIVRQHRNDNNDDNNDVVAPLLDSLTNSLPTSWSSSSSSSSSSSVSLSSSSKSFLLSQQQQQQQYNQNVRQEGEVTGKKDEENEQDGDNDGDDDDDLDDTLLESLNDDLSILPKELPGYTGWARPITTLVNWFRITGFSAPYAKVGHEWSVYVECTHPTVCRGSSTTTGSSGGGSLFYVRAYGRSVLPGKVIDHANGTYTVTIIPHDQGRHTLEIVLTCSQKPDYTQLPMPGHPGEPSYEGFMIPGCPLQFSVVKKKKQKQPIVKQQQQRQRQWCTAQQLVETSPDSALAMGRWRVVNKSRAIPYPMQWLLNNKTNNVEAAGQINMDNYINGLSSLGFQMDYFPKKCNLMPLSHLTKTETWIHALDQRQNISATSSSTTTSLGSSSNSTTTTTTNNKKGIIHILFIGDSTIRHVYNFFRDSIAVPTEYLGNRLQLTYVDMQKYWPLAFPSTKETLLQFVQNKDTLYKDHLFFTIFNAGMLEIANRCTIEAIRAGNTPEGPCHSVYQKDVQELVHLVQSLPSVFNLWQSTMASWPRWGVWGIGWSQRAGHKVTKDPDICGYMNELAWNILEKEGIPVMDAYWLTLSRPDHRKNEDADEITRHESKLIHLGPEVNSVLVRKVSMMILEALEKGTPGQRYSLLPGLTDSVKKNLPITTQTMQERVSIS